MTNFKFYLKIYIKQQKKKTQILCNSIVLKGFHFGPLNLFIMSFILLLETLLNIYQPYFKSKNKINFKPKKVRIIISKLVDHAACVN